MTQTLHPAAHQRKSRIVDELTWTPEVNGDHIGVAVIDGAVTLSGEVTSYVEKTSAVRAALRMRGVTDAATALTRSPGAGDLEAEVAHRWITLSGQTAWHFQRLAAVKAVEAVPGVAGVTNRITILPIQAFSADQAEARITAALLRNATVDAEHVHVITDGSTIELTGHVSSWAGSRQADHAAYATPGVTHVRNQLRVTP